MRRLALACALLVLAAAAAGCAVEDAGRAQELLQGSSEASAHLRSLSFEGSVDVTADGRATTVTLVGATRLRGGKPVAQVLRAHGPGFSFSTVMRDGKTWVQAGGRWTAVPVPAGHEAELGPDVLRRLASSITSVRVAEHQLVAGEPAATIACTIDPGKALAALGGIAGGARGDAFDRMVGELSDSLDDVDAVLVISERTHLLTAATFTLGFHGQGHELSARFAYRLSGVNRPVSIPLPAAA